MLHNALYMQWTLLKKISRDLFVFRTEMYSCSHSNGVTLPHYKEIVRMRKCQYYGIKNFFFLSMLATSWLTVRFKDIFSLQIRKS